MPHDVNGILLKEGDKVALFGTIKSIDCDQPTYCNITFRADEKMAPDADDWDCCLSARMVKLVGSQSEIAQDILECGTLG